jgi:hypothetical protein
MAAGNFRALGERVTLRIKYSILSLFLGFPCKNQLLAIMYLSYEKIHLSSLSLSLSLSPFFLHVLHIFRHEHLACNGQSIGLLHYNT